MITIDEIIAKKKFLFSNLVVNKAYPSGEMSSTIDFFILDEYGNIATTTTINLKGKQYNDFWNEFKTGTAIYDIMIKILGLDITADANTEDEFVNI